MLLFTDKRNKINQSPESLIRRLMRFQYIESPIHLWFTLDWTWWLQVPTVLSESRYTLAVRATGGKTFQVTRTVEVKRKTLSIFVQTDKAMYKPGQNG